MLGSKRLWSRIWICAALSAGGAIALGADEAGWEKVSDTDGIHLYKREVEGSDVLQFKGDGLVEAPLLKVGSVLLDLKRIPQWVSNIEEIREIRRVSEYEWFQYSHVGTPFILKDRDFVTRVNLRVDRATGEVEIRYRSTQLESAPKTSYVRGELQNTFVLKPVEGGRKTLFVGEIMTDPKGSVPKWIVNMFQKSWPRKTLQSLRRQANKADIEIHPVLKREIPAALQQAQQ